MIPQPAISSRATAPLSIGSTRAGEPRAAERYDRSRRPAADHKRMTTTIEPATTDPGPAIAAERANDVDSSASAPIELAGGHIRIGTASWTDPTMTAGGVFYPSSAANAEERLQFYASTFPLVEVDATYYALPSKATAELWVERTPPDFTFDIKAHALMTGQGTETRRLPKAIRAALPEPAATKSRIYAKDLPEELLDAVWDAFRDGLEPLRRGGPARVHPAPIPSLVLSLIGEPGCHRGRRRAS